MSCCVELFDHLMNWGTSNWIDIEISITHIGWPWIIAFNLWTKGMFKFNNTQSEPGNCRTRRVALRISVLWRRFMSVMWGRYRFRASSELNIRILIVITKWGSVYWCPSSVVRGTWWRQIHVTDRPIVCFAFRWPLFRLQTKICLRKQNDRFVFNYHRVCGYFNQIHCHVTLCIEFVRITYIIN